MNIFRFEIEDVDIYKNSIKNMLNQSLQLSFKTNITEDYLDNRLFQLKEYLIDDKAIVFGAGIDKDLIGFIWCCERSMFDEKMIHVVHFVVDETTRNCGVGSKLLNKVEEYAKEKNITNIELLVTKDNKNTVKFYQNKEFYIERYTMLKRLD